MLIEEVVIVKDQILNSIKDGFVCDLQKVNKLLCYKFKFGKLG